MQSYRHLITQWLLSWFDIKCQVLDLTQGKSAAFHWWWHSATLNGRRRFTLVPLLRPIDGTRSCNTVLSTRFSFRLDPLINQIDCSDSGSSSSSSRSSSNPRTRKPRRNWRRTWNIEKGWNKWRTSSESHPLHLTFTLMERLFEWRDERLVWCGGWQRVDAGVPIAGRESFRFGGAVEWHRPMSWAKPLQRAVYNGVTRWHYPMLQRLNGPNRRRCRRLIARRWSLTCVWCLVALPLAFSDFSPQRSNILCAILHGSFWYWNGGRLMKWPEFVD